MTIRTRIVVIGRVQGVGFRVSCAREARRLNLAGYVRNRSDGSVEIVAEGDDAAVASLTEWCRVGPPYSRVQSIEVVSEAPTGGTTFHIVG